jgi:hypothetical protein
VSVGSAGEVYGTQRKPRKRWGRRLLITFIVLVIVVVGLLAVADRVSASYAERLIGDKVSEQVAAQKATSEKPDVTIEGIPFLTQVADGRYQEIKILLRDFAGPAGNGTDRTIKMPQLDIRAQDVKAPLKTIRTGNGDIVASTVTGTATITYAELTELINQPGLKLEHKNGKLIGSAPVKALGQTYNVAGTVNLTVNNGAVQVRFTDVTAQGLPDLPIVRSLINAYAQKLALDLKVPALPLKLALQKVDPQADGLKVTVGARDVALNSGGL